MTNTSIVSCIYIENLPELLLSILGLQITKDILSVFQTNLGTNIRFSLVPASQCFVNSNEFLLILRRYFDFSVVIELYVFSLLHFSSHLKPQSREVNGRYLMLSLATLHSSRNQPTLSVIIKHFFTKLLSTLLQTVVGWMYLPKQNYKKYLNHKTNKN